MKAYIAIMLFLFSVATILAFTSCAESSLDIVDDRVKKVIECTKELVLVTRADEEKAFDQCRKQYGN